MVLRWIARNWTFWSLLISVTVVGIISAGSWEWLLPRDAEAASLAIFWLSAGIGLFAIAHACWQLVSLGREHAMLERLKVTDLQNVVDAERARNARFGFGSAVLQSASIVREQSGQPQTVEHRADWRRRTAQHTPAYGSIQRFVASLLLLLAVLGTFAGMKSALPILRTSLDLQIAASTSSSTTQSALNAGSGRPSSASLPDALEKVANAFGSNFIALLGSLCLATLGYALAHDRRRLLRDIESVARSYWFQQLQQDAGVTSLERTLAGVTLAVTSLRGLDGSVQLLSQRLGDYQGTLVDAMKHMFTDMSAQLNKNSLDAGRRSEKVLTDLVESVSLVTRALERTAVGYEGLVKGLQERDLGVADAAKALAESAKQAQMTHSGLSAAVAALHALDKQVAHREIEYQDRFQQVAVALQDAAARVGAGAEAQAKALANASDVVTQFQAAQAAGFATSSQHGDAALLLIKDIVAQGSNLPAVIQDGVAQTRTQLTAMQRDVSRNVEELGGRVSRAAEVMVTRSQEAQLQDRAAVEAVRKQVHDSERQATAAIVEQLRELERNYLSGLATLAADTRSVGQLGLSPAAVRLPAAPAPTES